LILHLLAEVTIIDCGHATALMAVNSRMEDVEDALQYYTSFAVGDRLLHQRRQKNKASWHSSTAHLYSNSIQIFLSPAFTGKSVHFQLMHSLAELIP